jgi:hypothetical protein
MDAHSREGQPVLLSPPGFGAPLPDGFGATFLEDPQRGAAALTEFWATLG